MPRVESPPPRIRSLTPDVLAEVMLLLWSSGFNVEAGRKNLTGTLFCLPSPGLGVPL